ncbi:MAG: dipeptide ABC transporter ATP-binding protein [Burkholderiaceae bacterium]|nr:MAG: dipeptide ABC transporter ATP-binding protein [Burkholderiaceae bacterium]
MLKVDKLEVGLDADVGLVKALYGLSLCLARGETFALVGESGGGKSMTAMALMRLLPANGWQMAGDVSLDGVSVSLLPEAKMREIRGGKVAMIFQEPATSLNPVLTVGQQLCEAIELHTPLRGAHAKAKAIEWLGKVGIPEPARRVDDYPFRMSGGQKQRVMIAMALATEPDFLIADEPTTALDVTIQKQILDLLSALQRDTGMGILLITHDLGVVASMAHRVALMYAGEIVEEGPAEAFFQSPRHPYAHLLLRALPESGQPGQTLASIEGTVPSLHWRFKGCRFAPRCPVATARCKETLPPWQPAAPGAGMVLSGTGTHRVRCHEPVGGQGDATVEVLRQGLQDERRGGQETKPPVIPPSPIGEEDSRARPASSPALLKVQDLHVRFRLPGPWWRGRQAFHAVRGVSFELAAGETLALVGESGSGKTTTGKALMHLWHGVADVTGQADLAGRDILQAKGPALLAARRQMQMVFQDPYASLNPRMRIRDVVEEGMLALRPEWDAAERASRLKTLMERVGLRPDALDRYPHEFSGGQRQRVAIARALAVEPQVLICDEPTSALDVSVQAQILNLLDRLQGELGLAYLFVTHNLSVVRHVAHRVMVMQSGEVIETGQVGQVMAEPSHPYTRRLLAASPASLATLRG